MNTERNWLQDASTQELEHRLARYREGSREADFVEADRIIAELKARRERTGVVA